MKKILYGFLALAAVLSSCARLDETPLSAFSEEEAYKSSTLIYVNSVAGIYKAIGTKLYGSGLASLSTLQEFSSDATFIPGRQGDWVDSGKWQNIFLHNFDSSVDIYNTVWNNLYNIIGLCNTSIDKLTTLLDVNEDAQTYIYELRALRAIFYYFLLDAYGEVPVVTSSTVPMSEVAQMHRSEVFDFVFGELTECLPHLSAAQSQKTGEYYGRVTQPVAYMALAKLAMNAPVYKIDNTSDSVYQDFVGDDLSKEAKATETTGAKVTTRGNGISLTVDGTSRNAWNTVIYCVEKLEEAGYGLQGVYADNFSVSNESSIENIFVQPNDESSYRITIYERLYSVHYAHGSGAGYFGANGPCATLRQMQALKYGEADADAERISNNYYTGQDYVEETGGVVKDADADLSYDPMAVLVDFKDGTPQVVFRQSGARQKKYELDKSAASKFVPNNDIVIWRYADALLMKAEAQYRLGNKTEALANLNKVRARAKVAEKSAIVLDDINVERLCEFSWEGIRRTDQVRLGTFTEPTVDRYNGVYHNASANDYVVDTKGYTVVFPIPYDALSLNPKMKQNPGYAK